MSSSNCCRWIGVGGSEMLGVETMGIFRTGLSGLVGVEKLVTQGKPGKPGTACQSGPEDQSVVT